jgi:predicted lipid-binding transport protein (Tim44 family)
LSSLLLVVRLRPTTLVVVTPAITGGLVPATTRVGLFAVAAVGCIEEFGGFASLLLIIGVLIGDIVVLAVPKAAPASTEAATEAATVAAAETTTVPTSEVASPVSAVGAPVATVPATAASIVVVVASGGGPTTVVVSVVGRLALLTVAAPHMVIAAGWPGVGGRRLTGVALPWR